MHDSALSIEGCAEWSHVRLADMCSILSGGTPPKNELRYWIGDVPWVSGKDMKAPLLRDTIDHVSRDSLGHGARLAPAGSVFLLVRGMGLAKDLPVAVASRDMAFNQDIKALVPHDSRLGPYIRAAIYHGRERLLSRIVPSAHGTMTLNLDDVERFEIPLPTHLDRAIAIGRALDLLREKQEAAAAEETLADRLNASVLQALFTRGLRGESQKESAIGPTPESWSPRPLRELSEIWSGRTPRKTVEAYWTGDIPWISGKDLKLPALDDGIDHVSQEAVETGSRLAPRGAVLLLVRGMGLAKDLPVAVINRPMAFNQDVKALVTRGEFTGGFLRAAIYAGKERLLAKIVPSAHGTMTLNLDDVATFLVPCPHDSAEAEDIVAIVDALERKIGLLRRKRAVLEELFKSLLHKLMTGEIRVADLDLSALDATEAAGKAP